MSLFLRCSQGGAPKLGSLAPVQWASEAAGGPDVYKKAELNHALQHLRELLSGQLVLQTGRETFIVGDPEGGGGPHGLDCQGTELSSILTGGTVSLSEMVETRVNLPLTLRVLKGVPELTRELWIGEDGVTVGSLDHRSPMTREERGTMLLHADG